MVAVVGTPEQTRGRPTGNCRRGLRRATLGLAQGRSRRLTTFDLGVLAIAAYLTATLSGIIGMGGGITLLGVMTTRGLPADRSILSTGESARGAPTRGVT